VNWKWMIDKIRSASRNINVLNLFAYTGGATVACAYANASFAMLTPQKDGAAGKGKPCFIRAGGQECKVYCR